MRFRQGAQDSQCLKTLQPTDQAPRARPLDVGLINDHDGLAVECRANVLERGLADEIGGWIVRRAQVHQFDRGAPRCDHAFRIDSPVLAALEGQLDYLGALNAGRNLVHAEGGPALQDRIAAGTQVNTGQNVDGFVSAARREHLRRGSAVERRPALDYRLWRALRLAV